MTKTKGIVYNPSEENFKFLIDVQSNNNKKHVYKGLSRIIDMILTEFRTTIKGEDFKNRFKSETKI